MTWRGKKKGVFSFSTRVVSIIVVVTLVGISLYGFWSFLSLMSAGKKTATLVMEAHRVLEDLVEKKGCLALSNPQGGEAYHPGTISRDKIATFSGKYRNREPECAESFLGDYRVIIREEPLDVGLEDLTSADAVIMLVMDTSGSMSGSACSGCSESKIDAVKRVGVEFVKNISKMESDLMNQYGRPIKIMVGLVTFDIGAHVVQQPTPDKQRVVTAIQNGFQLQGQTCIGDGISQATNLVIPISSPVKHFIVLSDGCPYCSASSRDGVTEARNAHSMGVVVHGIFFGDPNNQGACPDTMRDIALEGDGEFFPATDPQALDQALQKIKEDIEAHISSTLPPQPQTVTSPIKEWSFGVDSFSPRGLVYSNVTVTMPVPIRDGDYERRGVITIVLVDGELERVANAIQAFCSTVGAYNRNKARAQTLTSGEPPGERVRIKLSRPVTIDQTTGLLCYQGTSYCKNVSCTFTIDTPQGPNEYSAGLSAPPLLEEGSYYVILRYEPPAQGLQPTDGGTIVIE